MKKTVAKEQFSNIITPPDFIETGAEAVVLIDPDWGEIEDVAFYLKSSPKTYNVYVYRFEMDDLNWLHKVVSKSTVVIVNTVNNESSGIKDKLALSSTAYYYGPKNFLMNQNRLEKPIDYFVK